jgi:hypothetical protein
MQRRTMPLIALLLAATIVFLGALLGIAEALSAQGSHPEIALPLLATIGILILLAALSLIAVAFQSIGLSNNCQPLGLPEGSVRSLIAIGLLLLFAIVALFLYSDMAGTAPHNVTLSKADADLYIKTPPPGTSVLTTVPNKDGSVTIHAIAGPTSASQDLAKQIVTLLGTLLASVVAFYFGSSTAISAAGQADRSNVGPPAIVAIKPPTFDTGSGPKDVTIAGHNLDLVQTVKATSGSSSVAATNVKSNATEIDCCFAFPMGTAGTWDLVVTDKNGLTATLPAAITVTAVPETKAPPESGSPTSPTKS